jgi:hypothetical protein
MSEAELSDLEEIANAYAKAAGSNRVVLPRAALDARYQEQHASAPTRLLLAATAEVRSSRSLLREAMEALEKSYAILWMAEKYAEAGGQSGPEMRGFREAAEPIRATLAKLREAVGDVT